MANAAGETIQCTEREMEFATLLLHAHPRNERFARLRIVEDEAELARWPTKIDIVDGERLSLAASQVNARERRSALIVFSVQEPVAICADTRPIFIRLAESDFSRVFQRALQRNVPQIVVSHAAIGHDVSAA